MSDHEPITSQFWQEIPNEADPFVADRMLCSGYDVFQSMLGKADMLDYFCVLLFQEKPTDRQKALLNHLAIALGNPGPRDPSVRAAMTSAAGGSSPASCLMAALACGSGNLAGSHEMQIIVRNMHEMQQDTQAWRNYLSQTFPLENEPFDDVYKPIEHPPGFFDAHEHCSKTLLQCLDKMTTIAGTEQLNWLRSEFDTLNEAAGCAMQMSFLVGAAFYDLNLTPEQSEFVYLYLRLPGAVAHSLEQRARGWRDYPFHANGVKFEASKGGQ